ncbi:MAG: hypothetical protein WC565_00115 [Parcubacteria group bacterium]
MKTLLIPFVLVLSWVIAAITSSLFFANETFLIVSYVVIFGISAAVICHLIISRRHARKNSTRLFLEMTLVAAQPSDKGLQTKGERFDKGGGYVEFFRRDEKNGKVVTLRVSRDMNVSLVFPSHEQLTYPHVDPEYIVDLSVRVGKEIKRLMEEPR